jgi:sec-independent protein translocase protein TatA
VFSGLENPIHLLVILVIVLILFGPKRLPDLGRSIGRGMREFRESVSGRHDEEPPALEPGEKVEKPDAGAAPPP